MRFLLAIIPLFSFSQNVITINIARETPAVLPNPKVRIYQNGNLVSTQSVINGTLSYNYGTLNTTYTFEPFFDSVPSSLVTTNDWKAVADEAMYVDAPNGQKGLFLNTAQKFWTADVKGIKKLV